MPDLTRVPPIIIEELKRKLAIEYNDFLIKIALHQMYPNGWYIPATPTEKEVNELKQLFTREIL